MNCVNKEAGRLTVFSSFAPGRRLNASLLSTKQRAPITATYLQPHFFALPVPSTSLSHRYFSIVAKLHLRLHCLPLTPRWQLLFLASRATHLSKCVPGLIQFFTWKNGGFWSQSERVGLSNPTLVVWVQPVGARISHLLWDRAVNEEWDGLLGKMLSLVNHFKKNSLQIRHLKNFLKATGNQIFSRFNRLGFSLKEALAVFSAAHQPATPQHKKPLKQAV